MIWNSEKLSYIKENDNIFKETSFNFSIIIKKIIEIVSLKKDFPIKNNFQYDSNFLNYYIDNKKEWDLIFWESYFNDKLNDIKNHNNISIILPSPIWDAILTIWIIQIIKDYLDKNNLNKKIKIYTESNTNISILKSIWINIESIKNFEENKNSYIFNLFPDLKIKDEIKMNITTFILKKMWKHKTLPERLIRTLEIFLWIKLWENPKKILDKQELTVEKREYPNEVHEFINTFKKYIIIQPNASNQYKEYSSKNWFNLLNLFLEDSILKNYWFIFLWYNGERINYQEEISKNFKNNKNIKSFYLKPEQIASIIANSEYLISPSTWFWHLSGVLWNKTITLCNEANPEYWKSHNTNHINLVNDNPFLEEMIDIDISSDRRYWNNLFDEDYIKKYSLDNIKPKQIFDIIKNNL